jgi:pimeloyl-ACP methyl ester carboxylesterase
MYIRSFDGIKIFYYKHKIKKPKGTILFVHGGFYGNHTLLKGMMQCFKKEYNIIAPDLRGRGNSDFPKNIEHDNLENYAKDLFEILRYEKIKKIFLVGISFGGLISLKFSMDHCKGITVKKMILISSTYNLKEINKKTKIVRYFYTSIANLFCFLTMPLKEHRKDNIDYSTAFGRFFSIRYGLKSILNNSLKTIVLRYKIMKKNMGSSIPLGNLKKLDTKMLLIYGEKDFFFKLKSQQKIKENAKECIIKKIPDAGHDLYIHKGKEVAKIIKGFLSDN